MSITEEIIDIPAEHIRNVFGEFDHYIKNYMRNIISENMKCAAIREKIIENLGWQ